MQRKHFKVSYITYLLVMSKNKKFWRLRKGTVVLKFGAVHKYALYINYLVLDKRCFMPGDKILNGMHDSTHESHMQLF